MTKNTAFSTFRKTSGLTLDAAAEMFSVSRKTILRWEQCSPPVPVNRLNEIEEKTGIPRHELRPDIFNMPSEAAQ